MELVEFYHMGGLHGGFLVIERILKNNGFSSKTTLKIMMVVTYFIFGQKILSAFGLEELLYFT